jgi:hypothetical protein
MYVLALRVIMLSTVIAALQSTVKKNNICHKILPLNIFKISYFLCVTSVVEPEPEQEPTWNSIILDMPEQEP